MPRRTTVHEHPGMANKKGEQIPAKPFADWLNRKIEMYDRQMHGPIRLKYSGGHQRLAAEIGWGSETGWRRLSRYRHQRMSGSQNLVKGERHTDWFSRQVVEDALHTAGVQLWEVYPELVEDIILEPDRWCPTCSDVVTPIDGCCPWDETRVDVPDHRRAA